MARRVCVIGAGESGLAAARALAARGVASEVYERGPGAPAPGARLGRYGHLRDVEPPLPEVGPCLREVEPYLCGVEPYPGELAPPLRQVTPPIRFRTTVGLVEPDGAGYTVTLDGGRARHFSHVVVASGLRRERPGRVDGCAGGAGVPSRCGGDRVADFPFLPSDAAPLMVGPMRLFRRIVMPGHERMFFVGFVRPRGAWAPVVLAQARWVAEVVVGGITLPGRSRMADALITDERALGHRLRHVPHPTVEIDDHRYRRQLQRDRDRARRPAATRQAPPRTAAAAPAPTRC